MPYDPRMLQMARAGIGMMGPQASPFDRAHQPFHWWEQPLPAAAATARGSAIPNRPANRPIRQSNRSRACCRC